MDSEDKRNVIIVAIIFTAITLVSLGNNYENAEKARAHAQETTQVKQ